MKITDVRVTRVQMPRVDPAWRTASYAGNSVVSFILEIDADGMTGIGGTAGHPRSMPPDTLEAQLNGPVKGALLGADALCGNAIRDAIRQSDVDARALIAADLALYDLVGKAAKLPCHALWGGALRPRVRIDRMVGIKAPDDLVAHVGQLLEQGITHMKVKVGTGVKKTSNASAPCAAPLPNASASASTATAPIPPMKRSNSAAPWRRTTFI